MFIIQNRIQNQQINYFTCKSAITWRAVSSSITPKLSLNTNSCLSTLMVITINEDAWLWVTVSYMLQFGLVELLCESRCPFHCHTLPHSFFVPGINLELSDTFPYSVSPAFHNIFCILGEIFCLWPPISVRNIVELWWDQEKKLIWQFQVSSRPIETMWKSMTAKWTSGFT